MDGDVHQTRRDRRTASARDHAGFRHAHREGRGVPLAREPDDVPVREEPRRTRRAGAARRLFRRRRGLAVRARPGHQGIQERARARDDVVHPPLKGEERGSYSPLSAPHRSDSASKSAEITNTRCTATSQVILVASKAASMFKNASSTWIAEIATIEASSFCFSPAKSILVIHKGQFGLPDVSMRETKFS